MLVPPIEGGEADNDPDWHRNREEEAEKDS
jgi:hypothetical protein